MAGAALVAAVLAVLLFDRKKCAGSVTGGALVFFARFCLLFYCLAAVMVLFKPNILLRHWGEGYDSLAGWQPVPFEMIRRYARAGNWVQLGGNVLVTVPLAPLLWWNTAKRRVLRCCAAALCVTVLIEPVQLLINFLTRSRVNVLDVDDLILNLAGCLAGCCIALFLHGIHKILQKEHSA
jgi:glycopeptide antibiotics resistance protein